jgi:hypothetical protein
MNGVHFSSSLEECLASDHLFEGFVRHEHLVQQTVESVCCALESIQADRSQLQLTFIGHESGSQTPSI